MEFPHSVIEKLNFYVYLLIDPRTDEVFYVGKGTGNRIFSHLNASIKKPIKSEKLDRIREIRCKCGEVKHIVLRHGLTEKEAFEVEASLIDILGLTALTNVVSGVESNERGIMSTTDIIAQYAAHRIIIVEPSILIIVNKLYRYGMDSNEIYEITRGNWVMGIRRELVKYAFSVYHGVVREVFKIQSWFPVEVTSGTQKTRKRWRFNGVVSKEKSHYIGGDISYYMKKGNQNPIRYLNC